MRSALEINGLTKLFGRLRAVDNLSLSVPEGSVFGLLGPNGSGKTTTLSMVLGAALASSGSFRWFGSDQGVLGGSDLGAILEKPNFYPYMSGWDNLVLCGMIKGCGTRRAEEVLKMTGLFERRKDRFQRYSLGMKQRLAIASALLADPRALILDEPTNGLDPMGIAEIRSLIKQIAAGGKTIILASHLLDEVQKVCTDFAILKSGRLIHQGSVAAMAGGGRRVLVGSSDPLSLAGALESMPGLRSFVAENGRYMVETEMPAHLLNSELQQRGIAISHLEVKDYSLEELFLERVNSDL